MNNTQKLEITINKDYDTVQVGQIVATTTSKFSFNSVTHQFDNRVNTNLTIIAEHINSDYSNYDPNRCRDGGSYGYDYYRVVEVME